MNLNKVIQAGRLTRDPERKTFNNGGAVTKLGLCVNGRKKNTQSGQWEDEPMFIDVEVFNRGENGKAADNAEKWLKKGNRVIVVGRLVLEQWNDKTSGAKRSKHKIIADELVFIDRNDEAAAVATGRQQTEGPAPSDTTDSEDIPF
jgi:single-strand DNA-binding protein